MNNSVKSVTNIAIFLVVFVLVSNIPAYFHSLRIGLVQWHFWLTGIAVLLVLLVFAERSISVGRDKIPHVIWNVLFVCLGCLSLLLVSSSQASMEQFIQYGWICGIGVAITVSVRSRSNINACGYGVVAAVCLLAVLTIMEFADPNFQVIVDRFFEDKNQVGGINRSGALFENPNNNGHVMVLGMFVGQFFLPAKIRFLFYALVGAAVFCTVSRASIVVWGMAMMGTLFFGFGSRSKLMSRLIGTVVVVFLAILLVSGEVPKLLVQADLEQYMNSSMMDRLSGNFFTQEDDSSDVRKDLAAAAWNIFIDNPLLGAGLGATDNMILGLGAHNQFLKIAGEQGVFGMLIYISLIFVAIYRKSMVAVVFVLLFFTLSFFSHGMLTYPAFAILVAAAVVFLPILFRPVKSSRRRRRRSRSKLVSTSLQDRKYGKSSVA